MVIPLDKEAYRQALVPLGNKGFNTLEYVDVLRSSEPALWAEIEQKYGKGGRGAGKYFSAYSFASQILNKMWKDSILYKLDYRPSPPSFGSPIIRYWTLNRESDGGTLFPDEAGIGENENEEGAVKKVLVSKYERDPKARAKCIERYGLICGVCRMDFEKIYGPHGAGFIHVHHLTPISQKGGVNAKVDPVKDLCPVCPNCHAMIHYKSPMLSIEALKEILSGAKPTAG